MGKKLPPEQIKLYNKIDEILFYEWDPIGISDGDLARDEYHSYLPRVFSLALQNEQPESIAEYLGTVTTESMGMSLTKEHDMNIAKKILEMKKSIGVK